MTQAPLVPVAWEITHPDLERVELTLDYKRADQARANGMTVKGLIYSAHTEDLMTAHANRVRDLVEANNRYRDRFMEAEAALKAATPPPAPGRGLTRIPFPGGSAARRAGWDAFWSGFTKDEAPFPKSRPDLKDEYQTGWTLAQVAAVKDPDQ